MKLKNPLSWLAFIAAASLAFAACDDADDPQQIDACEEDPSAPGCDDTTPTCEEDPTAPGCDDNSGGDPAEPSDAEKHAAAPELWRATSDTPSATEQPYEAVHDGYRVSAVVDARAGGAQNANSNSWNYIDLHSGEELAISDVESFSNSEWDLAIRRTAVRINSGHSGPGSIEIARLTGANFDMLHEVPDDLTWASDELTWELVTSVDPDTDEETKAWEVVREPFGFPWGAINEVNADHAPSQSWYSYGGPGGLGAPYDHVYLVRDGVGGTFKLQFTSYAGAIWGLRWEALFGACDADVVGEDVDTLLARRLALYDYENDPSGDYNYSSVDDGVATIAAGVGAGGSSNASTYSFTYFDLGGNFHLINDFEAAEDADWVLGIRRQIVVVNGGDYGPGGWEIARALNSDFDTLMEAPGGLKWETEFTRFRWMPDVDDLPVCDIYGGYYGGIHRAMEEINLDRTPMTSWFYFTGFANATPYEDVTYYLRNQAEEKIYALVIDTVEYPPLAGDQAGSSTTNTRMNMRAKALPWPN